MINKNVMKYDFLEIKGLFDNKFDYSVFFLSIDVYKMLFLF